MAPRYPAHVTLTPAQRQRLGSGLAVQLKHQQLHAGPHEVHLSAEQAARYSTAKLLGGGLRLQLTPEQIRAGGGFLDQLKRAGRFIKAAVLGLPAPRDTVPPAVRAFLQKHGGERVTRLAVGRVAVGSVLTKVLNFISLGKLEEAKKQLGYEHIWHTCVLLTLADGIRVTLERNHVVSLGPSTGKQLNGDQLPVPLYAHPTLAELVARAERSQSGFWRYSHDKGNCQALVHAVLQSSPEVSKGAMQDADAFYRQDSAALAKALGPVGNEIGHRLTDLAASGDRVLNGDGVRRRKSGTKR